MNEKQCLPSALIPPFCSFLLKIVTPGHDLLFPLPRAFAFLGAEWLANLLSFSRHSFNI